MARKKIKLNDEFDVEFDLSDEASENVSRFIASDDILDDKTKDDEDEIDLDDESPKKKRIYNKKPADKDKFYVQPKEFHAEIERYYESGVITDDVALMISKIANKLSYAPNFINYSYREEFIGDAIVRMFKALVAKKYDPVNHSNPFAYFTRIAYNAFINRIKKEKYMHETHQKYQEEFILLAEGYNSIIKNNNSIISRENI